MKSSTRGVHHLALTTEDLKGTTEFYVNVVGMPLVHAMKVPPGLGTGPGNRGNPPYEEIRHYFFDMGNDSLFAIFEYPKGLPKQNRDHLGGMQHIAFHVRPEKLDALIEQLKRCGVEVIGPVPLGGRFWSAYLYDPFGIRLEFATDRSGVSQGVVESVLQTEEEARAELETLFSDLQEVEKWLRHMPLRKESATVQGEEA